MARRSRAPDRGRTAVAPAAPRRAVTRGPRGRASARGVALEVLVRTETTSAWADRLLEALGDRADLEPRDRGLATELALGTLRWQRRLDWMLARASRRPLDQLAPWVRALLRLTAYQLAFLDRIPAWAAVHEAVELAKQRRSAGATALRERRPPGARARAAAVARPDGRGPRRGPRPPDVSPDVARRAVVDAPRRRGGGSARARHERGAAHRGADQHAASHARRGGGGLPGGRGRRDAHAVRPGGLRPRARRRPPAARAPPGGIRRRPGRGGHPGRPCARSAPRGDGRRRLRGARDQDLAPGGPHGQSGPRRRRRPERGAARAPPDGVRPARRHDRRVPGGRRPRARRGARAHVRARAGRRAVLEPRRPPAQPRRQVAPPARATSRRWSPRRRRSSTPPPSWSGPAGSSSTRPAPSSRRRTRRSWPVSGRADPISSPTLCRPPCPRRAGRRPTCSG